MVPTPEQQEQAAVFILFFIVVVVLCLAGGGALVFGLLERRAKRAERVNDRAPVRNAIEPRSVSSERSIEPVKAAVVDAPTLVLIQQIAAHKLKQPSDGKEATALAVSGAKKGSSKAYQAFAQAWDLLYPPFQPDELPAGDPKAWEAGEREGQMIRRARRARPPLPV